MVINMVNMVMIKCNIEVKLTCRFWWQTDGCLSSVRWPRTHLPKRCRQTWSVGEQVWAQDGGLRTKQLEQVVCWQWPPHSRFSIDTDLQREIFSIYASNEVWNHSRWIKNQNFMWKSYLAEHISLGFALQNSHVHSGLHVSALRTSSTVWKHESKMHWKWMCQIIKYIVKYCSAGQRKKQTIKLMESRYNTDAVLQEGLWISSLSR